MAASRTNLEILMCYLRDVACRVELELKLFPDLGKQILERSHRMGSVSLWESPGTPMIDIVYIVPTTINTGKELVQSSVGICLEIVDDLLASIFGVAGHTLTPSQVQRPKHALLDVTFGDKIIKDLLRRQQDEDD